MMCGHTFELPIIHSTCDSQLQNNRGYSAQNFAAVDMKLQP